MSPLTQPKIDCHCHVIDPLRFPYQDDTPYRPAGQEVAPFEHLMRVLPLNGVSHALIVATNSGYGADASPVLDAIERGAGRLKGVAVVDRDIAAAGLAALRARGIIGVAFNVPFHGAEYYASCGELLRKLADLDMILQLQIRDDQLLAFLPLIARIPVRLVIDHCGRPAPARGLQQAGFSALLALGRARRASVKLSGFSQFSAERHPYADTHAYVAALLDAFTPEGCVWGSDWPFLRATERIDYGPLVLLAAQLLPDEVDRHKVFWETPRRLFGFGA